MDFTYKINEIVWVREQKKTWWPGIILEQNIEEKSFTVQVIGEKKRIVVLEEKIKSFDENLDQFKRTKNFKVLSAILAAQKIKSGESTIDAECENGDLQNNSQFDAGNLKIKKNESANSSSFRLEELNRRRKEKFPVEEGDDSDEGLEEKDSNLLKKVKKLMDPSSEHSLTDSEFSNKESEQKIFLGAEFYNRLCSGRDLQIQHHEESKLALTTNAKPEWVHPTQQDRRTIQQVSGALIEEIENKFQLYLANFILKLQNQSLKMIEEKDPDLTKIEKLVLSFDLDVLDSPRLIKSNFVKMVQTLEIAMEKNRNKLTQIQQEFTLVKISSFLRKVKEKILYETFDCSQYLNTFRVFENLEVNKILQSVTNPEKHSSHLMKENFPAYSSVKQLNGKVSQNVINLISDDSGQE